jgi:hypothetical protein
MTRLQSIMYYRETHKYRSRRVSVVPSGIRQSAAIDIDRVRPAWNESNRNGPDRHRNRQTGNGLRSILRGK